MWYNWAVLELPKQFKLTSPTIAGGGAPAFSAPSPPQPSVPVTAERKIAREEEEDVEAPLMGAGRAALGTAAGYIPDSLRGHLGMAAAALPPPKGRLERVCDAMCGCFPALGYSTRLAGFVFCFALGLLLSLASLTSFASVLVGNPGPFAFKYTVGNVLSMSSYCFLHGPAKQCRSMLAPQQRLTTLAYLGSLAATLYCVLVLKNYLLTLAAIAVQFCAMLYHAMSFFPLGQAMLASLARRIFGC